MNGKSQGLYAGNKQNYISSMTLVVEVEGTELTYSVNFWEGHKFRISKNIFFQMFVAFSENLNFIDVTLGYVGSLDIWIYV